MRNILAASLLALSTAALAAPNPVTQPTKLSPEWQAKTRTIYETSVEIPTVAGRNEVPKLANYLADQLKAAGFAADDIKIMPYEGEPGDKTVALIARWRADKPTGKPILLMAHMDVVEAKREDWKQDPFEFIEKDGYFYGRGSYDNKAGMVGLVACLPQAQAVGLEAGSRPHPVLHRRRGNRRQGRAIRRDRMAFYADRRGICAELGRRRRRLPRQWQSARLRPADRREDLPELLPHRPQQGRAFEPPAARQCHLRAGDGPEEGGGAPL